MQSSKCTCSHLPVQVVTGILKVSEEGDRAEEFGQLLAGQGGKSAVLKCTKGREDTSPNTSTKIKCQMLNYAPFDYACMKHVSLLLQRKWFASLPNLMNCNSSGKLPDAAQCLLQAKRNYVLLMSKLLLCKTDLTGALKYQLQLTFCKNVPLHPDTSPHCNYHTLRFISLWSILEWTMLIQHPNLESLQIFSEGTNFHNYFIFDSYLVNVYSLSPEWRFMAEKVPMQPRSRLSRPVFHVTKSGLKRQKKRKRNPPAFTDTWWLRGDNQGMKDAFAFSPSSKPQQAGLLTC